MKIHSRRLALTLAAVLGGVHVVWSLLVLFGWAQPVVDFLTWAHMIETNTVVGSFDATAAFTLVVVTAAIGWGAGTLFAKVWNAVGK